MITVFSKEWFKKYNKILVKIARLPFIGELVFNFKRFGHYVDRNKIIAVRPNSVVEFVSWKKGYEEIEVKEHFFVRNEYALRLQSVFYPIWITFHIWDIITRPMPQLNLGFDTLTVYPGSIGTDNPVNGQVSENLSPSENTWANVRNAAGTGNNKTTSNGQCISFTSGASSTPNRWEQIIRSIFCFDTSGLTSGATISATTLSLYGTNAFDGLSATPNIDVYLATPAATDTLANGDYAQIGTTSQTGSPITYANWSTSSYNVFTFNIYTGISKTGITSLGVRNANYDVANSQPPWIAGEYGSNLNCYFAHNATNKPKLVVTYTLPVSFITQISIS